jgi:hypothetical protein
VLVRCPRIYIDQTEGGGIVGAQLDSNPIISGGFHIYEVVRVRPGLVLELQNTPSKERNGVLSLRISVKKTYWLVCLVIIRQPWSDAGKAVGRLVRITPAASFLWSGTAAMASNGSSTVSSASCSSLLTGSSQSGISAVEFLALRYHLRRDLTGAGTFSSCSAVSAGGGRDAEQLGAGEEAALLHLHPAAPPGPSPEAIRHGRYSSLSGHSQMTLHFLFVLDSVFSVCTMLSCNCK